MKIRINDLARELEVKSKAILDVLTEVGVTEKKTHSSSLEDHEAELVRKALRSHAEAGSTSARSSRPAVHGEDEFKTKIDLSHISRPGDVLRAITQQKVAAEHPIARPPVKPLAPPSVAAPSIEAKAEAPAPPAPAKPAPPKPAAEPPAPRFVTPASVAAQRPPAVVVIPPRAPAAPPAGALPPSAVSAEASLTSSSATPAATAGPPAVAVPPRVAAPPVSA